MNPARGSLTPRGRILLCMQTRHHQKQTLRSEIRDERAATTFERQVAHLFRSLGYRVHRRPATHDLGVDVVITRPGWRAIVQCKHWRHPVGPACVRDLYGTLHHTGADLGILATTSTISRSAERFADGKPLLLIDGAILRLLISHL